MSGGTNQPPPHDVLPLARFICLILGAALLGGAAQSVFGPGLLVPVAALAGGFVGYQLGRLLERLQERFFPTEDNNEDQGSDDQ